MTNIIRHKWALSSLLAFSLFSCQSESIDSGVQVERKVYNVPTDISLEVAVENEARALDFVINESTQDGVNVYNPYLELEQFQKAEGLPITMIFVRTDANAPVSMVTTTLKPEGHLRKERFLRTEPEVGNTVSLASGTNLGQGTWKVALFYGNPAQTSMSSVLVDPNNMQSVMPNDDSASDVGIDLIYNAGRSNISGITVTDKGQQNLTDDQKVSLHVPFLSDWVTITPSMIKEGTTGSNIKLNLGRIVLRPQGSLLRVQVRNQDFSSIKLAGFRLLTNSLAFRGDYDFSESSLRTNASSANGDLSILFSPKNARGEAYIDSVDRMRAYPNYADFWVSSTKAEDLRQGQDSKYYLIWAMPIKDKDNASQNRKGNLHVMVYDANRNGDEYNRSKPFTETSPYTYVIPKALIRKPALTTSFDTNRFRISSGKANGQFFRLHGVQTQPYNFLDFMVNDTDATFRSQSELASVPRTTNERVADKEDWAGIFPVKFPDNPAILAYDSYRQYFDHYYMGRNSRVGSMFNSNLYGIPDNGWQIGPNQGQLQFIISSEDKDFVPEVGNSGLNPAMAGKSNNKQTVRVPALMQVPKMVRGQVVQPTATTVDLLFGAYTSDQQNIHYATVGWGEGQTYLSGIAYRYTGSNIEATSRYLGPAYHRPYNYVSGGGEWHIKYPWDINFYYFNQGSAGNARATEASETEDTWRTLPVGGHRVNNAVVQADGHAAYWSSEGKWVYIYYMDFIGNVAPGSGYGNPGTVATTAGGANRVDYNGGNPQAMVRKFSTQPQGKGR